MTIQGAHTEHLSNTFHKLIASHYPKSKQFGGQPDAITGRMANWSRLSERWLASRNWKFKATKNVHLLLSSRHDIKSTSHDKGGCPPIFISLPFLPFLSSLSLSLYFLSSAEWLHTPHTHGMGRILIATMQVYGSSHKKAVIPPPTSTNPLTHLSSMDRKVLVLIEPGLVISITGILKRERGREGGREGGRERRRERGRERRRERGRERVRERGRERGSVEGVEDKQGNSK